MARCLAQKDPFFCVRCDSLSGYSNIQTMKTLPLMLLAAHFLLLGCQSDSKTVDFALPPAPQAKPPGSPSPEMLLYAVTVDKLNLRSQPNKRAQVITQFTEGEIVEGNGEVSANKEEATLRNIPYNEPYFNITSTKQPSQFSGWAYSAALEPLYAGSRTTSPDLDRLSRMSEYLQTLPVEQLTSGKSAIVYTMHNFTGARGTLADAAFILLERFLFRLETAGNLYPLTQSIAWEEPDFEAIRNEQFNMKKYPVTKTLAENGFRLEIGEGMVYPIVDWAPLADFFVEKVTPPMKTYLVQRVMEQKDNVFDDGGIVIGLDTLAERAAFWEEFNRQNPYFVRKQETQEYQRWMRLLLLTGSDNSGIFDDENHTVAADFKNVWTLIGQRYPGTQLAKDARILMDLCVKVGWKQTTQVETWVSEYRNNPMNQ